MSSPVVTPPPGYSLDNSPAPAAGGAVQPPPGYQLDAPGTGTTDQLKSQGFWDSAWESVKALPSMLHSMATGEYQQQAQRDQAQISELEKNGTPEQRRAFAKDWMLRNFPFASTIYKATHGNVSGALGDVAGMTPYMLPEMMMPEPKAAPQKAPGIMPDTTALPEKATASTASKLQSRVEGTDWGSLGGTRQDLDQAAAAGDNHASQVLEQMQNAGNDPKRVMQASINLSDWRTSQVARELYDKVQDLAENKYKLGPVPLQSTRPALQRAMAEAQFGIPNKAVMGVLRDVDMALQPKPTTTPAQPPSAIVDPTGNPMRPAAPPQSVPSPPQNTYSMLRKLSDQLGERIRMNSTGDNALIGPEGIGQLQAVKAAIDNDLSNFVSRSGIPELQQAGAAADSYYKQVRVPFKDINLSRSAITDEPDTIYQKFIQAGRGDRAQKFFDALDPKGRAAVQYEMVNRALAEAYSRDTGTFSSAKLSANLAKLQDAYGVFFQGQDKLAVDGLRNLAQHAANLDKAPLGTTTIAAAGVTEALTHLGMPHAAALTGAVSGLSGMAKALLMTDRGRAFLYRASSLKPGTAAMDALWTALRKGVPEMRNPASAPPAASQLQPQQQ